MPARGSARTRRKRVRVRLVERLAQSTDDLGGKPLAQLANFNRLLAVLGASRLPATHFSARVRELSLNCVARAISADRLDAGCIKPRRLARGARRTW